ncbi:probable UDP-3-O-acylglucosamine N-acyltransferase 2, mitochondrial isoform X2 [Gossypium raimondii]|uniref:probable UDP-3-O-acylglucosamine N-acyltransferase 2, mitochondrial isoform X2 n=1 Tax=Gossypium raimondii TaxID=29730 RepID=UPI00063AB98C|nr:probable UDP-3-O-acylglucosamine N-acyltransferase 2, mitochondrial isoform X2 [Gossypium raimondii]
MAVTLKRLSSIPPLIFRNFPLSTPSCFGSLYNFSVSSTDQPAFPNSMVNSETGADVDDGQEFLKWKNGGGHFHKSACIDPTVVIEIGAIVHPKSVLGANVHVGSGTAIGPCVKIGQFTKIGYNAALSNCTVGDSCVIHNGVCIGQDGKDLDFLSMRMATWSRSLKPMLNESISPIWLCSWRDTVIGDHTKIDNLVQIGHNVVIGKSCMLCGQVGIAGSVIIGDYVVLGGRVAVRDHVSIISKVRLAANSCVTKDIREPGDYGGFPAVPIHVWRRQIAIQCRSSKKGKS